MKKHTVLKMSSALVLLSTVLMASGSAYAQKGSRLCGWTAQTPAGAVIGLLYEAREADATYHKQCDEVIARSEKAIKDDANMSKLSWTKVERATCESVGNYFKSGSNPSNDMCDYMEAKKMYKVMKMNGNTTSYTKT